MGIRQTLGRHPRICSAGAIALILAAGAALAMQAGIVGTSRSTQAYYSTDDGKTYFAASSTLGSPATIGGQTAYRCFVFQCDKEPFVAYLVRYPEGVAPDAPSGPQPQARPAAPPAPGEKPAGAVPGPMAANKPLQAGQASYELKKPGDLQWIRSGDMIATAKLTRPRCAGGAGAEPLLPR